MPCKHTAPISRADLLQTLILAGADCLGYVAEFTGYQALRPEPRQIALPELPPRDEPTPPPQLKPASLIHYYRVIDRQPSPLLAPLSPGKTNLPDWFKDIPPLELDSVKPAPITPPDKAPLVPWAKLWPVLRAALSETRRSRQVDVNKLVCLLAQAQQPSRIPRRQRQGWIAGLQVLIERAERTELFNDDYNQLLTHLALLRGDTGLQAQQMLQRPGGPVRMRQGERYITQEWRLPEPGGIILILSDLGLLDPSGQTLQDWLRFGQRLRLAGCLPVVLLPLPQRYLIPELLHLFSCICWTRHSDLQPVQWVPVAVAQIEYPLSVLNKDRQGAALDLLAWLSPVVRVEPALLRAACYLLPNQHNNTGVEVAAWLHEDVHATNIGFYFKPTHIEKYRRRFRELVKTDPLITQLVVRLLRRYHRHVFPTQLHEEMLILAELLGEHLNPRYQDEVAAASLHGKQLLKALHEQAEGTAALPAFLAYASDRQHLEMFTHTASQHWPGMLGILKRENIFTPKAEVQNQISKSPKAWQTFMAFLYNDGVKTDNFVLYQLGSKALQISAKRHYLAGNDGFSVGSLLLEIPAAAQVVVQQQQLDNGEWLTQLLPLATDQTHTFEFKETEQQRLHVGIERVTIERFVKPDWATAISRSQTGLSVTTKAAGKSYVWYWRSPGIGRVKQNDPATKSDEAQYVCLPGFWHYQPPDADYKPEWADYADRDRYGLFADVNIAGIIKRFRWIEPGSFTMGSPNGKGRRRNETPHQVILTRGYWLADTACTQALWQAVMLNNPSEFKGENHPVENISWSDAQEFLQQLNRRYPKLALRLPTEAEWEYACRAGTTGPFNFDGDISLAKANYRGVWEYKTEDKWGVDALQKTASVKHYPPNDWGLYEMHGNVREYCEDWYAEYPTGVIIDPAGSETRSSQVLRGGSWNNYGEQCCSSFRDITISMLRSNTSGFRLARSHEPSPVIPGADQTPTGEFFTKSWSEVQEEVSKVMSENNMQDHFKAMEELKEKYSNNSEGLWGNIKNWLKK